MPASTTIIDTITARVSDNGSGVVSIGTPDGEIHLTRTEALYLAKALKLFADTGSLGNRPQPMRCG